MIPRWTRWVFLAMWASAAIMVVAVALFALAGDWWLVVTMAGVAASIAAYPWTWKTAYRLGHANGRLEVFDG